MMTISFCLCFFSFYVYKYSTRNTKWQVNGEVSSISCRERIPFHLKLCENYAKASLGKWLKYDIIYPVHAIHHNLVICGWFFPKIQIRSKARSRTQFVILLWLEIKKQFETITASWCLGTRGWTPLRDQPINDAVIEGAWLLCRNAPWSTPCLLGGPLKPLLPSNSLHMFQQRPKPWTLAILTPFDMFW